MRHAPVRHRLGLMVVIAGLSLLFVWDSVHGQGFRPRMPGTPPRPPFGGGMGGGFQTVYSCSKCGNQMTANSSSILEKPSSCSKCGVRFINGGLGGTGQSAGNNPTTPPAGMPATGTSPSTIPPMAPNPAPQNPVSTTPPQNPVSTTPPQTPITPTQPAGTAPPIMPVTPAPATGATPSNPVAPTVAPARSSWVIPGVIAIVVLSLVGVGGVWMMVSSLKGDEAPPRRSRSRSRRSRDEDDDD